MMKKIAALFLALMLLVPMGAFASSSSYTISFAFDRLEDDVEQLNEILSTMNLAHLDLNDTDTYLATTRNGAGEVIKRRLGLTSGTFLCELAEDGNGHTYHLMTEVVDLNVDHEQYEEMWKASHPGMVMRIAFRVEYDECAGYVIAYHERVN